MGKFISVLIFLFLFNINSFAQDKVPTIELVTSVTTTVGSEVRLNRIEIEINDDGLKASRIKLFAGIGKTKAEVDADTGSYLFETYRTQLVYEGTVGDLLVNINTVAGQDQANLFASDFIKLFYDKEIDKGLTKQFNSLVTLLIASGKLSLDPAIKVSK